MSKLAELLQSFSIPETPAISYKHVEDLLRQSKFSGPVTTHWNLGIPRRVEIGKPYTVPLKDEA